MKDAKVGSNCNIGQNVVISPGVVLGNNVKVQNNVSLYTPVVVKYRDEKTDASTMLEDALR